MGAAVGPILAETGFLPDSDLAGPNQVFARLGPFLVELGFCFIRTARSRLDRVLTELGLAGPCTSLLTGVGNSARMPKLAEKNPSIVMNTINNGLPSFYMLFLPNPRCVW